jgi:hypothetical protein
MERAADAAAHGQELAAPKAFNIQFNLAGDFEYLFACDPVIGHYFYGNVNTKSRYYGCTRMTAYGGANDALIGVWVRGTPRIWAGGNASLYLENGNVTVVGGIRSALANPTGVLADGDFADLYVDGLETSQVAFPVRLNGQDRPMRAGMAMCISGGWSAIRSSAMGSPFPTPTDWPRFISMAAISSSCRARRVSTRG